MVAARQKNPALLADKRKGRGRGLTVLERPESFIVPEAPTDLGREGKAVWESFWRSEVSAAVDIAADRVDLEDWVRCVDERARYRAAIKAQPLIEGSHGQLKRNPLAIDVKDLSERIQKYSDRFGMNPMARWRLQFTVSEAGKSANDLLKLLSEEMPDVIDLDDM